MNVTTSPARAYILIVLPSSISASLCNLGSHITWPILLREWQVHSRTYSRPLRVLLQPTIALPPSLQPPTVQRRTGHRRQQPVVQPGSTLSIPSAHLLANSRQRPQRRCTDVESGEISALEDHDGDAQQRRAVRGGVSNEQPHIRSCQWMLGKHGAFKVELLKIRHEVDR